jgi:short-subunit dehydrogenase
MTQRLKPLDQQVIVVTGASSGIGLATARRAAARGASVVLIARSEGPLAEAAAAIRQAGGTADTVVADVGDAAALRRAGARAVERFGRVDSWISDAGTTIYARLLDTPADEHAALFRTNYFGTVHSAEAAVPLLARQGGAFVAVGSVASDIPSPIMGAYAASKHALKAYVAVLRMELADSHPNVSVTLVKPSGIDTPIAQHAANHEGGEAQIPPPIYTPELVADAILDACVHPRREITVGGGGRAQALFSQHFPALYEALASRAAKALFVDRRLTQPAPPNLERAGVSDGRERSGEHPAAKSFSLYTSAARHPKASAAMGLGVLGVAAALLFANRGGRERDRA